MSARDTTRLALRDRYSKKGAYSRPGRSINRPPRFTNTWPGKIDFQSRQYAIATCVFHIYARTAAPHPRQQLAKDEGLDHVIIRPQVQSLDAVVRRVLGRKNENVGGTFHLPQYLQHRQPREPWAATNPGQSRHIPRIALAAMPLRRCPRHPRQIRLPANPGRPPREGGKIFNHQHAHTHIVQIRGAAVSKIAYESFLGFLTRKGTSSRVAL